ncbi:MAG TPA: ATP-binding protein [Pseudomonadota bacterium]|jgi:two-component system sensor histidine kinase CreC|nr:ATP-binding protein [Pseudomonadota bacterium]
MSDALPVLLSALLLVLFAGFVGLRLLQSLRRGLSIRMQVFVAMAAVSGCFAALLGVIAVQRLELRAARLFSEVAQEHADLLAKVLGATQKPLAELGPALATAGLPSIHPEGLRLEVVDLQGQLVYAAGPAQKQPLQRTSLIRSPQTSRVIGEVRVQRNSLGLRQILTEVAARAAVLALLLAIGTALASALIGRAIAKPIERLTQAASRIAQGERQAVLPRPFGREVRTLTRAVESMRRELEGRHLAEQLAVDLSHELKNPVAAIRASAEVLADGALEEPETARRFVARILEATQRVLGLCNNLLMLTRLQARGVNVEPVDLADLLLRSADSHAAHAQQKQLRIVTQLPGPALVSGDSVWLRRAIDNLVNNALTFAQPQPDQAQPEVTLALHLRDSQVCIEVKNTGPGIAPAIRDRLFERFVTTRRDNGGSGLGLAIVAAVAEQHGGSVEVVTFGPPETCIRMVLPSQPSGLHQIFP